MDPRNTLCARSFKRWSLVGLFLCLGLTMACSRKTTGRTSSFSELRSARLLKVPASDFQVDVASFTGSEWALWRNAALVDTVTVPAGVTGVAFEARGSSCSGTWPQAELFIQGTKQGGVSVASSRWQWYLLPLQLRPGAVEVKIAFVNDRFSETEDMNLYVRDVIFVGDSIEN